MTFIKTIYSDIFMQLIMELVEIRPYRVAKLSKEMHLHKIHYLYTFKIKKLRAA